MPFDMDRDDTPLSRCADYREFLNTLKSQPEQEPVSEQETEPECQ